MNIYILIRINNNMILGLAKRIADFGQRELEKEERKFRSKVSHILVNEKDAEKRFGVRDYTNKGEELLRFARSLDSFGIDKQTPIVKVKGLIASLDIRVNSKDMLSYEGFLDLEGKGNPLFFGGLRDRDTILNIELERVILEAGKRIPITMIGHLFVPFSGGDPYRLNLSSFTGVVRMRDYVSPSPGYGK